MNVKLKQNVKSVFDYNKNTEIVFVTSDGQVFLNERLAQSHSVKINGQKRDKTLKYTKVIRQDFFSKSADENKATDENKSADENKTTDENKSADESKATDENKSADENKKVKNTAKDNKKSTVDKNKK